MIAIELFEDGDHTKPDAKLTAEVVARARDKGLILLSCGPYYNVLRILVPLTIEDAQIRRGWTSSPSVLLRRSRANYTKKQSVGRIRRSRHPAHRVNNNNTRAPARNAGCSPAKYFREVYKMGQVSQSHDLGAG